MVTISAAHAEALSPAPRSLVSRSTPRGRIDTAAIGRVSRRACPSSLHRVVAVGE